MKDPVYIDVVKTVRLPSSAAGNPRWKFLTEDDYYSTAPNIGDAYKISDGFTGPLTVEVNGRGQVTRIKRERKPVE